jgi:hypothetical protein
MSSRWILFSGRNTHRIVVVVRGRPHLPLISRHIVGWLSRCDSSHAGRGIVVAVVLGLWRWMSAVHHHVPSFTRSRIGPEAVDGTFCSIAVVMCCWWLRCCHGMNTDSVRASYLHSILIGDRTVAWGVGKLPRHRWEGKQSSVLLVKDVESAKIRRNIASPADTQWLKRKTGY